MLVTKTYRNYGRAGGTVMVHMECPSNRADRYERVPHKQPTGWTSKARTWTPFSELRRFCRAHH